MLHHLLQRQIREILGNDIAVPENVAALLQTVSNTYSELHAPESPQPDTGKGQHEKHLLASQRIANIGSWELNIDNLEDLSANPLYWSEETYRIFGYEPGEVEASKDLFFELVHPDEREKISAAVSKALSEDTFYEAEHRLVLRDGTEKIVNERSEIVYDAVTGKPLRMIGTVQDITAWKAATAIELELKNSEHKFRSMIENSYDAITVCDKDLKMIFASDSLYRVTGHRAEETTGLPIFGYAHPEDRERVAAFMKEIMDNPGQSRTIIYRTLRKDGNYIWCERISTNLLDDPAVRGIVSNLRNITERKEQEEALKASNEELKKSNAELDRFVYSVSHDLRAPLASILGLSQLAETETTDSEVLECLELIKTSVKKLDSFIQDILDYSRNARTDVKTESIHFEELLHDIQNNIKFIITGDRKVKLEVNVQNGVDFHTDKGRVSIILNNLLSNAIRYHNPDAPQPYVKMNVQLSKDAALITVKDNGIGISAENREKIFEMFFRVSSRSMGSGLGLYIVKETVEKLKGKIELISEPGKGTEFTVVLPNLLNK